MAKIVQQKAIATHWPDMKCHTALFLYLGQEDVIHEFQIHFKYPFWRGVLKENSLSMATQERYMTYEGVITKAFNYQLYH